MKYNAERNKLLIQKNLAVENAIISNRYYKSVIILQKEEIDIVTILEHSKIQELEKRIIESKDTVKKLVLSNIQEQHELTVKHKKPKLYTIEYQLEKLCRLNKKNAKGMQDILNKDINKCSKGSKPRVKEKQKLQRINMRIL